MADYKICAHCGRPFYGPGEYCDKCYDYKRVTQGYNACRHCSGTGIDPKTGRTCTACGGTGKAQALRHNMAHTTLSTPLS